MLVCAETGKELHSGVAYTQDDLERAKPAKLLQRCRHCGKLHIQVCRRAPEAYPALIPTLLSAEAAAIHD
jgi:hypothetical protein